MSFEDVCKNFTRITFLCKIYKYFLAMIWEHEESVFASITIVDASYRLLMVVRYRVSLLPEETQKYSRDEPRHIVNFQ